MFDYADEFFQSLGMTPMTDTFWEKSVIKKREDVDAMVCHASARDFMHGPGDGNFDFGDKEHVKHCWYNLYSTTIYIDYTFSLYSIVYSILLYIRN